MPAKTRQAASGARRPRRKERRNIAVGQAHIKSTFNNPSVSIPDPTGAVIAQCSSGQVGFKGSRKSTPYAAQLAAEACAKVAVQLGVKEVEVEVTGAGNGRESAIRAISQAGLEVTIIRDRTPVPHNGCRPRKQRRV
mgnify:CR=1 FL=1